MAQQSSICNNINDKQRKAAIKFLRVMIDQLKSCEPGVPSPKRQPSKYQLHMKHCASGKAKGGLGKSFSECVQVWRDRAKG